MTNWVDCSMPYWAPLEDEPYLHDEVAARFGPHISYAGVEAAIMNDMTNNSTVYTALHNLLSDINDFVSGHPKYIAWRMRGFAPQHPGCEFRLADGRVMVEGSVMSATVRCDARVVAYREVNSNTEIE